MMKILLVVGLLTCFTYADTTLCEKGDMVVFSCDIKKKKLSICKGRNQRIVYKYGTQHKVELEINKNPKYSHRQFVKANEEFHLRFHNKGYDYVVYTNELMNNAGGYKEHAGVYVVKDTKVLTRLTCRKMNDGNMIGIASTGKGVLKETYIGY